MRSQPNTAAGAIVLAIVALSFVHAWLVMRPAQAQPAQPAAWCQRWTDNCTTCVQAKDKAEAGAACTTTRPGACRTGPVRCLAADTAALKAACERWSTVRDNSCNTCSKPDAQGRRLCTLMACPPRDIVCVTPKR